MIHKQIFFYIYQRYTRNKKNSINDSFKFYQIFLEEPNFTVKSKSEWFKICTNGGRSHLVHYDKCGFRKLLRLNADTASLYNKIVC